MAYPLGEKVESAVKKEIFSLQNYRIDFICPLLQADRPWREEVEAWKGRQF